VTKINLLQLPKSRKDSWQEAHGARHGFLNENLPYKGQERSQNLGGSSPVQEDGNGKKAAEKPMERTIIPGQEAI
jgi:hypothetical protein